jgi:hypothetical protein
MALFYVYRLKYVVNLVTTQIRLEIDEVITVSEHLSSSMIMIASNAGLQCIGARRLRCA